MSKLAQEKEEAKALIRGLLTSSKQLMTAQALFYDFKNMAGYEVPYRKFGFANFEAFLRSIPETVMLQPSGGSSPNVLLVTSEKSKHIDELVQKQRISVKKKGPRRPIRNFSVKPLPSLVPSPIQPLIPHGLQERISEYLVQNSQGVDIATLEKHLWIFQVERFGGIHAMLRQLTHIAKVERGKVYPVNHAALNDNLLLPLMSSSFTTNAIPAGHEDDRAAEEEEVCDDWEAEYYSSDEEAATTPVNDAVIKPTNDAPSKQPATNKLDDATFKHPKTNSFSESSFKQPTANNFSESTFKQPTASRFSESTSKQATANNFSESTFKRSTADDFNESTFKQPTTNNFNESIFKQPTANFNESTSKQSTANFNEPIFKQPKTNFSESTFKQPTTNYSESTFYSELAFKQPKTNFSESTFRQPKTNFSESTFKQPTRNFSESSFKQPTTNNFSESTFKQPTANFSETSFKQPTANFNESTFKQPTANNFSESVSKQSVANNFSEAAYRNASGNCVNEPVKHSSENSSSESSNKLHTADHFNFRESDCRHPTPRNLNVSTFRKHTLSSFVEPAFKQNTEDNFSEPGYRQSPVKHLSDPAAFSTFTTLSNTEVPKLRERTSSSHIGEKMKKNLQILAEKHPDGIWCSELPKLYQQHFGVDLNVQNLGFVSVVQFVADIPDIFQSIQPNEADWMVFDARKSIPEHCKSYKEKVKHMPIPEHVKRNLKKLTLKFKTGLASSRIQQEYVTTFGKPLEVSDWGYDSVKAFLLSLQHSVLLVHFVGHQMMIYPKPGVEEELAMPPVTFSNMEDYLLDHYPAEVAGPKCIIPQQALPPDLKFCDHIEVIIAEVFTPTKFFLQLRGEKTTVALDKLMTDMQDFYNTAYNNELYKMREPTYREFQYCVAPYSDEYHRALIMRVFADEVQVKYIDYGTVDVVKKRHLRHLHNDFISLPAQAIRAKLANLQPFGGTGTAWPLKACKRFLALVSEKPLVAIVHTVDYETKVLEIALVDTTGEDDVHINDTLKNEGYADYCKKKKDLNAQKQTPKQEVSSSIRISESNNNSAKYLAKKLHSGSIQNVTNWSSVTAPPSTSGQVKDVSASKDNLQSSNNSAGSNQNVSTGSSARPPSTTQTKQNVDEEEPIKISTEKRRFLPPPGFSNRSSQQLPSLDSLTLMNMAFYQQLQQQQQQQMLQNMMIARGSELFLQGNSNLGSTLVTPYAAAGAFPMIAFPLVGAVMPNIGQVPAGNAAMLNTMMPNITPVPAANSSMINSVMPNMNQVPSGNINMVMPHIAQVPTAASTMTPNITEVPTSPKTVDSGTMTTFEEATISELTDNLNSVEEDKTVEKICPKEDIKLQNNISVQEEEDLDEDFIFRSDSEGEDNDNANEQQVSSIQEERNVMEEKQVVTNNYENVNTRQPQLTLQQQREMIIRSNKLAQPERQAKKPVDVKVVEIAGRKVHVINIGGEAHMSTDELAQVFANFSSRFVILKILESQGLDIPFKEIKEIEYPNIFHILQSREVQGLQKPLDIEEVLHLIHLRHVVQLLTLLKIEDTKILGGVHATLESSERNEQFWLEP